MSKYHKHGPIQTAPFFRRSASMSSLRRVKTLAFLVLLGVIVTLFYTSSSRRTSTPSPLTAGDFYSKTLKGLDKRPIDTRGGGNGDGKDAKSDEGVKERLKEAAQVAKDNANAKAPKPDPPSAVVGKGSAAEGAGVREEKGVAGRKKYSSDEQKVIDEEKKLEREVKAELNVILKKSPIIVFSKSYCPHSKRAKDILEQYDIVPAPYIVELDQHPLGPRLQARLTELTGRRTVPNVLINAVSIGGGDDVAALHESDKLVAKILELGAKKIDVTQKASDASHGLR